MDTLSKIAPTSTKAIPELYWIFGIILFGGVILFFLVYIAAFFKGMKTGTVPKNLQNNNSKSAKRYIRNINQKVCKFCGNTIDSDSNFCKNCGNKIN